MSSRRVFGLCLALFSCIVGVSGARAGSWVLRAGATQQYPVTTGPEGYGNHGLYDGNNGGELDRADRKHANWDQAPGVVVELARKEAALWRAPEPLPFSVALEPFARITLVDTEFNETQRNWVFVTQVVGSRVLLRPPLLPWLAAYGGMSAGWGHVAKEFVYLWESEVGLEMGPFRVSKAAQHLEDDREVRHLYVTQEFVLDQQADKEPLTDNWSLGVFTRLTQHSTRQVKIIHQTGAQLTHYFGTMEDVYRPAVEFEVSIAPVESESNLPLNPQVEHNYRTKDEVFWALYFGQDRRLKALRDSTIQVRAGIEGFYEDDPRVNAGGRTGWFLGGKFKAGLWRRHNELVSYGMVAVAGVDDFGTSYGVEIAIASRL